MKILLATLAAAASLAASPVAQAAPSADSHSHSTVGVSPGYRLAHATYPTRCEFEDDVNCTWHAHDMTNHTGHTFVAYTLSTGRRSLTCHVYRSARYAVSHDSCEPTR